MRTVITMGYICLVLCFSVTAFAQEQEKAVQPEKAINLHKMIRIHYSGAVIPETLTVQPGSTVIWINESKRPVEIQFQGKQVTLACKSPVHFILDEQGSFLSNRIPYGAVASLCFIEKGTYTYNVRKVSTPDDEWHSSRQRGHSYEGKIIVE